MMAMERLLNMREKPEDGSQRESIDWFVEHTSELFRSYKKEIAEIVNPVYSVSSQSSATFHDEGSCYGMIRLSDGKGKDVRIIIFFEGDHSKKEITLVGARMQIIPENHVLIQYGDENAYEISLAETVNRKLEDKEHWKRILQLSLNEIMPIVDIFRTHSSYTHSLKFQHTFATFPDSPTHSFSVSATSKRRWFNPRHLGIYCSNISKKSYDFTSTNDRETIESMTLEQLASAIKDQLGIKFPWSGEYGAIDHRIDSILVLRTAHQASLPPCPFRFARASLSRAASSSGDDGGATPPA